MKIKQILPLLLVIGIGCFLLRPVLDFQFALAQGDHGRDLYIFEQVSKGRLLYQDLFWNYGPLMPYYYALFFKFAPVAVHSVLAAKTILQLGAGIMLYQLGRILLPVPAAILLSAWFWIFQDEFIYTYNHIGGIFLIITTAWSLFAFLKTRQDRYIIAGLVSVFLLGLIKLNFGVVNLCVIMITLWRRPIYLFAGAGILAAWGIIYYLFLHGLSAAEIQQCMPYFGKAQPHHTALLKIPAVFWDNARQDIIRHPSTILLAIILTGSMVRGLWVKQHRNQGIQSPIFVLGLFYLANMHEFISSGTWYCTYWAQPILFLIIFWAIDRAWINSHQWLRAGLWILLAAAAVWGAFTRLQDIQQYKTPSHWMNLPRTHIYTSQEKRYWIGTVQETAQWLNNNIPAAETFFALPYDPLYYFLTGKESPTRQLVFFQFLNIPQEQEIRTIKDIEQRRVNYILLSNYIKGEDGYRGTFGKDYCPLLAAYIFQHFQPVIQFGDWSNAPGWADHHGVLILKRK